MHRMSDKTIFIVTVEKERETAKAISSLPFQKSKTDVYTYKFKL